MEIRSLGRYEIAGELGRGSMGVVYRAHDPIIDRPVALKTVILPDSIAASERDQFLKRFFQEARAAGRLIHQNIVVTYDAATDEATGTPFIAMEFIDGQPLSHHLRSEDRIPWEKALEWCAAIALALDHAHREGVVHRDIKPANILITRAGVPKIADFGIAKPSTAHLTQTGVVVGTPYFMSPEQLRGEELDGRSDVFSLGAVLYTLVTGERPFEGKEIASIASQVLHKNPRPLTEVVPGIPPFLDGVVTRALMKSRDERYGSGEELARDPARPKPKRTGPGSRGRRKDSAVDSSPGFANARYVRRLGDARGVTASTDRRSRQGQTAELVTMASGRHCGHRVLRFLWRWGWGIGNLSHSIGSSPPREGPLTPCRIRVDDRVSPSARLAGTGSQASSSSRGEDRRLRRNYGFGRRVVRAWTRRPRASLLTRRLSERFRTAREA